MDEIEIPLYDEINDYKEKLWIMTLRQWLFSAIIAAIVIPTYWFGRKYVGEDIISFAIIIIAGVLGFIGFVKIHSLSAEKIIPYWYRHYMLFAKPIEYMSDKEYELQKLKTPKNEKQLKKSMGDEQKLNKAMKKYGHMFIEEDKEPGRSIYVENPAEVVFEPKENTISTDPAENNNSNDETIDDKFNSLSKEEKEVLLKLINK